MPKITDEELLSKIDRLVDELPEPSPEQCRRVAAVLRGSQARS